MSSLSTQAITHKRGLRSIPGREINLETPPALLDAPLTPLSRFFVRNNGGMPTLDERAMVNWTLTIDGEVEREVTIGLDELKSSFEIVDVESVLECAGNGRAGFSPPTDGLPWGPGAVGCAIWRGVRLMDVLRQAGVTAKAVYVGFESPDCCLDDSTRPALSRGLPIAKALSPETLLAFAMNGEPLALVHGFPLRIVAPGFPGSAWQKWLHRVWVRACIHDGEKMTGLNYRLPTHAVSPGASYDADDFEVITDLRVKSLITSPAKEDEVIGSGEIDVAGYAWSGHVPVAQVGVSADGGQSWQDAHLAAPSSRFGWRRFEACLPCPPDGEIELVSRAMDEAGNRQPLGQAPWNPRGYLNNGVYRVPLRRRR